jgi:hypothetical protein
MSPKERLDWYRGTREREANAKEQNKLIPFDVLDRILGHAFGEIRSSLLSQHNTIASEYPEIPPDAIRGILTANKNILKKLSETRLPGPVESALDKLAEEPRTTAESER